MVRASQFSSGRWKPSARLQNESASTICVRSRRLCRLYRLLLACSPTNQVRTCESGDVASGPPGARVAERHLILGPDRPARTLISQVVQRAFFLSQTTVEGARRERPGNASGGGCRCLSSDFSPQTWQGRRACDVQKWIRGRWMPGCEEFSKEIGVFQKSGLARLASGRCCGMDRGARPTVSKATIQLCLAQASSPRARSGWTKRSCCAAAAGTTVPAAAPAP